MIDEVTREYLKNQYPKSQLVVTEGLKHYVLNQTQNVLSKAIIDNCIDQHKMLTDFFDVAKGQFKSETDDKIYHQPPFLHIQDTDRNIARFFNETPIAETPENCWTASLLVQDLNIIASGIRYYQAFCGAECEQKDQIDSAIENFVELFSDYQAVTKQLLKLSFDPSIIWPVAGEFEKNHHKRREHKKSDETADTTDSASKYSRAVSYATIMGNRIKPVNTTAELEEQIEAVEAELQIEYDLAQNNESIAKCIDALHSMELIAQVLKYNSSNQMYPALQNVAFYVDLNASLIEDFWNNYSLANEGSI